MRMTVKDQSVLQKRAAAGFILRLTGAWGRQPSNKQKHLLGPRCPACGCLLHRKEAVKPPVTREILCAVSVL